MAETEAVATERSHGVSIAISVLMIIVGFLALAMPLVAGVAVTAIFAWGLILVGFLHLVFAWQVRGVGSHLWEFLVALVYLFCGIYTFMHPLAGLVGLTAILGAYLLIKGIMEIIGGLAARRIPGSGWLLLDGVISLVLSCIIWAHVLAAATWVIGTLLGFSILFTGFSRLLLLLSVKRAYKTTIV